VSKNSLLNKTLTFNNTSPDSDNGYTASHRVIGVSIGYKFGGK